MGKEEEDENEEEVEETIGENRRRGKDREEEEFSSAFPKEVFQTSSPCFLLHWFLTLLEGACSWELHYKGEKRKRIGGKRRRGKSKKGEKRELQLTRRLIPQSEAAAGQLWAVWKLGVSKPGLLLFRMAAPVPALDHEGHKNKVRKCLADNSQPPLKCGSSVNQVA